MTERARSHSTAVSAGCFRCWGSSPRWLSKNAMMLAARHHDTTGHPTWAEQILSVRFGKDQPDDAQGALPL